MGWPNTSPIAYPGPPPGSGVISYGWAQPPPHPLDVTRTLRFKSDAERRHLGGFVVYDDASAVVLRGARVGHHGRALSMDFVVEDDAGHPVYLIRRPEPHVSTSPPYVLLDPAGVVRGEFRWGGMRASLTLPNQAPYVAASSTTAWNGYSVSQGDTLLASVMFEGHPYSMRGAELILRFGESNQGPFSRQWVVALVSFATFFHPPWKKQPVR